MPRLNNHLGTGPGAWLQRSAAVSLVCAAAACGASAAEETSGSKQAAAEPVVLAEVGGQAIYLGEVNRGLAAVAQRRRELDPDSPQLKAAVLRQIVRRRLALARLAAMKEAAPGYLVKKEMDRRRGKFTQRGLSFEESLQAEGVTPASVKLDVAWNLAWALYRKKTLTDEYLQRYFTTHRRDWDGTQLRAAHILLRPPDTPADAQQVSWTKETLDSTVARARRIRQQIVDGTMTFEEAARRFSAAPSGKEGGDLGFFPRRGIMHPKLADAAFALNKGAVSEAVVTPHGVHLLRVLEEEAGSRSWKDARPALDRAAELALFDRLVAEQRKKSRVKFADVAKAWGVTESGED